MSTKDVRARVEEIEARNVRQRLEIGSSDPRWVSDEVRAMVDDVTWLLAALGEQEPVAFGWRSPESGVICVAMEGEAVESWRREVRNRPGFAVVPLYARPYIEGERIEEWRPIETAPKDGTNVLIAGGTYYYDAGYCEEHPFNRVVIARWMDFDKAWRRDGFGSEYDGEYWHYPTHWMPLPALPSDGDER